MVRLSELNEDPDDYSHVSGHKYWVLTWLEQLAELVPAGSTDVWPPTLWVGVRYQDGNYGIVSPEDWDPDWGEFRCFLPSTRKAVQWACRHKVVRPAVHLIDEKNLDWLLKSVAKREEGPKYSLDGLVDEGADSEA